MLHQKIVNTFKGTVIGHAVKRDKEMYQQKFNNMLKEKPLAVEIVEKARKLIPFLVHNEKIGYPYILWNLELENVIEILYSMKVKLIIIIDSEGYIAHWLGPYEKYPDTGVTFETQKDDELIHYLREIKKQL